LIADFERSLEIAATHECASVKESANVQRENIEVYWIPGIAL
jgi:hypothetical protein